MSKEKMMHNGTKYFSRKLTSLVIGKMIETKLSKGRTPKLSNGWKPKEESRLRIRK
jgi:hypothetical protein